MEYKPNIHNIRKSVESIMDELGFTKDSVHACYICVRNTWYRIKFDELMKAAEKANLQCYNGSYQFIIFFDNGYRISLLNSAERDKMFLKVYEEMIIHGDVHEYHDINFDDLITDYGREFYLKNIRNSAKDLTKNFPDEIKEFMEESIVKYYADKFQL